MSTTPQRRGVLVAFEGIDGAGKTTQVRLLEARLDAEGIPFVSTKEPTTGPWGQRIRSSAQTGRMSAADELDAFVRDRREHVADLIEPSLAAGRVVIVDRYYPSTVAYQGARGLDPADLLALNSFAPTPDVLIILDVDPGLGLQRIRQRGDRADLFELEEELTKVRAIFRALDLPGRHLLDATRPPDDHHRDISAAVLAAWRARPSV
ncbi:MAG TPA: dTMP kinase [Kofleriaceae bacterium]|nr:dTMP kinase [Kofleriaceae bacterium]